MQNSTSQSTGKKPEQRMEDSTSTSTTSGAGTTAPDTAKSTAKETADKAVDQAKQAADQAKQTAREMSEQAKRKAMETGDEIREQVTSRLDERTNEAAGRLGGMADALHRTSRELHEHDEKLMAEYTGAAADQVERFSHYLQQHNTGDLLREVRRFAERQPELFVAGALAAGFMVGRFLKATPQQQNRSGYRGDVRQQEYRTGQYGQEAYRDPYSDNYGQYESSAPRWERQSPTSSYASGPYTDDRYDNEFEQRNAETPRQDTTLRDYEAGGA